MIKDGFCERVAIADIAREVPTPFFLYSRKQLLENCRAVREAFLGHPTLACYAVKANTNGSLLKEIFGQGFGAEIVSGGELTRVVRAGVDPKKVIFSGVGKTPSEIKKAAESQILALIVESEFEIEALGKLARESEQTIAIALRINPDIGAKTNAHVVTGTYETKFGLPEERITEVLAQVRAYPKLKLIGISCHLGSQLEELKAFEQSARRMKDIALGLKRAGVQLEFLDLGGGFPVSYRGTPVAAIADIARVLTDAAKAVGVRLIVEPGRRIVANAGALVTSVIGTKETSKKRFLVVDAAMTELIRPALYDAFHEVHPVHKIDGESHVYDIVGPVCESADFLGKKRSLPALGPGDLVWVAHCGAYASSMGSTYNSRPRAAEVLVDDNTFRIIRRRESVEELWALEL